MRYHWKKSISYDFINFFYSEFCVIVGRFFKISINTVLLLQVSLIIFLFILNLRLIHGSICVLLMHWWYLFVVDTRRCYSLVHWLFDNNRALWLLFMLSITHLRYFSWYFKCALTICRFKVSARFANSHSMESVERTSSTSQLHPVSFKFIAGESLIEVKEEWNIITNMFKNKLTKLNCPLFLNVQNWILMRSTNICCY